MTTSEPADSFVGGLSAQDRADLLGLGRPRQFAPGQMMMLEGDTSDSVMVVLSGRVKVFVTTPEGRVLLLAMRGAGELIGELTALDRRQSGRSASVSAVDLVSVRQMSAEDFVEYLERRPAAGVHLLRTVIERLREADRRRLEYGSFDTLDRVTRRLAELVSAAGGESVSVGEPVILQLTQQELAGWVGASREAVSRALQSLRHRKLIATERKRIVVLDPARLRAEVGRNENLARS